MNLLYLSFNLGVCVNLNLVVVDTGHVFEMPHSACMLTKERWSCDGHCSFNLPIRLFADGTKGFIVQVDDLDSDENSIFNLHGLDFGWRSGKSRPLETIE